MTRQFLQRHVQGLNRMVTRCLRFAQQVQRDAERYGIQQPMVRRRKAKKDVAAPAKPRGKRTPLKHTEEEGE